MPKGAGRASFRPRSPPSGARHRDGHFLQQASDVALLRHRSDQISTADAAGSVRRNVILVVMRISKGPVKEIARP